MWDRFQQAIRAIITLSRGEETPGGHPEQSRITPTALAPQRYTPTEAGTPLRQSEILTGLIQRRQTLESIRSGSDPAIAPILHRYAIIMSQDCDLEQDFNIRSRPGASGDNDPAASAVLPNVLLCEMVPLEQLLKTAPPGKDMKKMIMQNKNERYHVLEAIPATEDQSGEPLPSLGIDFKRYFTIPTDEVYAQINAGARRRCALTSPYLEHTCNRFSHFLGRVALPPEA
jgi:hypothetical protein